MLKVTDVERLKEFGISVRRTNEYCTVLQTISNEEMELFTDISPIGKIKRWYALYDYQIDIVFDLIKAGVVEKV